MSSDLPAGYRRWVCDICTAMCNFEAMYQCVRYTSPGSECGFDRDRPESNGGAFEFMVKQVIMSYRGYQGSVGREDGSFTIVLLHIDDVITTECSSMDDAEKTFHNLVDDYIQTCKKIGREPNKSRES